MSRWTMPVLVERVEPGGDLRRDPDDLVEVERPALEPVRERAARRVRDRDVVASVVLAGVEDREQVRVPHLRGGTRLLPEALP